jgi:cytochrome P450
MNLLQGEWIKYGLSEVDLEAELALQVPAGTETTLTAIRGTLLCLMTSPTAYQKLKKEICDGITQERISNPITNEEAKKLPYLQVRCPNSGLTT